MCLENTIAHDKNSPSQDRANAMIFLCHHIDEVLKMQYVMLESPLELWEKLKGRYDHLRLTLLPRARSEWQSLRFQDFKTVQEYNSAMFKVTSQLRHCGENIFESDMMEKTFSTFHASNMVLQQQYREKSFQKYSELITCLLLAEQNNELLLKNHESRPTGANLFPEANAIQPANPVPSANEHTARVKRGRPLGFKDKNPRKRKIVNTSEDINNDQISEKVLAITMIGS
ncbi:uncharacterized protein LOC127252798 [Andrographis paniculata]|uniref:uncharacterized protein LOC127252798 n=1 Tax=Andrographis paniculata TaxID=175694 RepID=UPI0021E93856|nr:uncharacterized protein LOC127252798 [Andrographis paniculata]